MKLRESGENNESGDKVINFTEEEIDAVWAAVYALAWRDTGDVGEAIRIADEATLALSRAAGGAGHRQ